MKIVENKLEEVGLYLGPINDIIIYYWDVGIHYYKPMVSTLNKLMNDLYKPAPNIYVVGEMLSDKQGWVEGAISPHY
jgi:hypothetical protein